LNVVASRKGHSLIRLAYVGRLCADQKRIFDLLPFLKLLDEYSIFYHLDIIGSGEAESELLSKLSFWQTTGKVKFHGWQDSNSLYHNFFPFLDCLVHFAHTEGFPTTPREAMAHGIVPVIAQYQGIHVEGHFKHGVNALTFSVGDIQAAVKHIEQLVKDPVLFEKLSKNAMSSQVGNFSYEGVIDTWSKFFENCINRPIDSINQRTVQLLPGGRLDKIGISPVIVNWLRKIARRRFIHTDPGSEWPITSGLCSQTYIASIMKFARDCEEMGKLAANE
jgi:hypothetical protein